MRLLRSLFVLCALGSGCPSPSAFDGGITVLPQVFITVSPATVIGTHITGTTTVSGCPQVTQVQILATDESFIVDANFTGNPSKWAIAPSLLNRFYQVKGIALPLSLMAKVVCDDGRTNLSTPVTVTYFPAASVVSVPGRQQVPDSFIAEGGLSGTATTFIGCIVNNDNGVGLARTDANGRILKQNTGALPFNCTYNSVISERSKVNFTHWLMEPGVGAFAFDQDLNVTNAMTGAVRRMAVSGDSSAILWMEDIDVKSNRLLRVGTTPGATKREMWAVEFPYLMNSTPVIDTGNGWIYTSSWQYNQGTGAANIVMIKYALADGAILNATGGKVPVLIPQMFGTVNRPIQPNGAFNVDGTLLYMPLMVFDANQNITSAIVACASGAPDCTGPSRRWTSAIFPTAVKLVLPFNQGNFIAGASDTEVYFVSSTDGSTQNLGGQPLRPKGSLQTLAVQPGAGADFYILNGPEGGYPSEIVATDAPSKGELWRLSLGSGVTPASAMFVAIDEGGQAWLRVGFDLVKPLTLTDYRNARGATPMP